MPMPLPMHQLDIPPPATIPFAIGSFDTIGPLSRANFPHRHTFYEIVLVTHGLGAHVVDLAERPLRPPQLCVIAPGQVHFWRQVSGLDGWVILFTDELLSTYPGDREVLRRIGELPALSGPDARGFIGIVKEMVHEADSMAPQCASAIQAYLHILVLRAARLVNQTAAESPPAGREAVAQQLARLLAQPGGHRRTVQGCARRLGVSMTYLNEAVKTVTGRTPGQLIRQVQVLEAKRLLARTTLAVAQISQEIGFADPAYFCRFFRRETGMSPGAYRRVSVEKHDDHPAWSIDSSEWIPGE